MLLWVILSLVILVVSFILALRSMWQVAETVPAATSHRLVCLTKLEFFTKEFLTELHTIVLARHESLAFELLWSDGKPTVYMWVSEEVRNFFSRRLGVVECQDYTVKPASQAVFAAELIPVYDFLLPIFLAEPMTKITSLLGANEKLWWQIVAYPVNDLWKARASKDLTRVTEGAVSLTRHIVSLFGDVIKQTISILLPGPVHHGSLPEPIIAPLSPIEQEEVHQIAKKLQEVGFVCVARLAVVTEKDQEHGRSLLASLVEMMSEVTHGGINSLTKSSNQETNQTLIENYQKRHMTLVSQSSPKSSKQPTQDEFIITAQEILDLMTWSSYLEDQEVQTLEHHDAQSRTLAGEIRLT